METQTPKIYTKTEFAKLLRISTESVDRYRKAGKLSFHTYGKRVVFTDQNLLEFLTLCQVSATKTPTRREAVSIQNAIGG